MIRIEYVDKKQKIDIKFSQEEKAKTDAAWDFGDTLLTDLSKNSKEFSGMLTWSMLKDFHWKFLIFNNLNLDKILTNDRYNDSLCFLLCGYVKYLENILDNEIEHIKILIIDSKTIKIDIQSTTYFEIKNKPKLKLV